MIKQQLQLKLAQKLSPQQIQLMKLIQLSTQELEQKIQAEIGENPALENGRELSNQETDPDDFEDSQTIDAQDIDIDSYLSDDDIPAYRTQISNYSSDQEEKNVPLAGGISFHQMLSAQLQNLILQPEEEDIATFLVGSVDDSGYIRRTVPEIVDDLAFTQNLFVTEDAVLRVLKKVQQLDPPGVAARSLPLMAAGAFAALGTGFCRALYLRRVITTVLCTATRAPDEGSLDEPSVAVE